MAGGGRPGGRRRPKARGGRAGGGGGGGGARPRAGGPGAGGGRRGGEGQSAGEAPRPIEVGAGEHLVVARADGRLATATLAEVGEGGAEVRLSLPVDPLDEALAALKTRPTRAGVAALVQMLGIDG